MSSEKPFWEGKTCEEMANLHVKVTFVAGAVLTGITDCSGHIRRSRNGSVVPISASRGAERFVPYRDIESIELLDDPNYERIEEADDLQEKDITKPNRRRQPISDYKQRMIREHRELQERISKLAHMLEGYAEGTLDFTPACSFQLLESQLHAMGTYANILQERARIEQVDLNAPLEGCESELDSRRRPKRHPLMGAGHS